MQSHRANTETESLFLPACCSSVLVLDGHFHRFFSQGWTAEQDFSLPHLLRVCVMGEGGSLGRGLFCFCFLFFVFIILLSTFFFHLFGISPCWQIELIALLSAVEMEGCSCPWMPLFCGWDIGCFSDVLLFFFFSSEHLTNSKTSLYRQRVCTCTKLSPQTCYRHSQQQSRMPPALHFLSAVLQHYLDHLLLCSGPLPETLKTLLPH